MDYDSVDKLPKTNDIETPQELKILDQYFKECAKNPTMMGQFKALVILTVIFVVLSCSFTGWVLGMCIPFGQGSIIVRTLVFIVLAFITLKLCC